MRRRVVVECNRSLIEVEEWRCADVRVGGKGKGWNEAGMWSIGGMSAEVT